MIVKECFLAHLKNENWYFCQRKKAVIYIHLTLSVLCELSSGSSAHCAVFCHQSNPFIKQKTVILPQNNDALNEGSFYSKLHCSTLKQFSSALLCLTAKP